MDLGVDEVGVGKGKGFLGFGVVGKGRFCKVGITVLGGDHHFFGFFLWGERWV